jgi:hypothetical protein
MCDPPMVIQNPGYIQSYILAKYTNHKKILLIWFSHCRDSWNGKSGGICVTDGLQDVHAIITESSSAASEERQQIKDDTARLLAEAENPGSASSVKEVADKTDEESWHNSYNLIVFKFYTTNICYTFRGGVNALCQGIASRPRLWSLSHRQRHCYQPSSQA